MTSVDSRKVSDRGGWAAAGAVDRSSHPKEAWERETDALLMALARKRIVTIDEHRRAMEEFPRARYESLTYYQRWIAAIEALLVEKAILTKEEVDRAAGA